MYNNQPYYGYQPSYYGPNGSMPDNLTQLRMGQAQIQTPAVAQNFAPQPASNASNGLIWVQGEAGAKSYLVAPGNTLMLMDSEDKKFYLKTADASGMPMPLRTFVYEEVTEQAHKPQNGSVGGFDDLDAKFVTREEFERRIASIGSGCKCREKAKKNNLMEESNDVEPVV